MALKFHLQKEHDDPDGVLRASIGGTPEAGYYIVYRGDNQKVIEMLEKILEQLKLPKPQDF